VAVKQLTNQVDKPKSYKKEIDALRMVAQHKHKHILPLLSSYSRPRKGVIEFCLIFPQARCNLLTLWEEHASHPADNNIFSWMLTQCRGLADALVQVHHESKDSVGNSLVGRQGNIHPYNVLVFVDGTEPRDHLGTLVLADFKNAEFYPQTSSPSQHGMEEVDRCRPSRWWDIWSLGCLLLSFVSWFLGGSELLKKLEAGFAQAYREARNSKESNPLGTKNGSEAVGHIIRKMAVEVRIRGNSGLPPQFANRMVVCATTRWMFPVCLW